MPNATATKAKWDNYIPPKQPPLKPIAVSIRMACEISGVGRTTLYEWINTGRVRTVKPLKKRLIILESLEELLGVRVKEDRHATMV